MYEIIRSKDNNKIKYFTLMHDRRKASKEGVIFIEGVRLCEDALVSGIKPVKLCCTEEKVDVIDAWIRDYKLDSEVTVTTKECFAKIASTVNPQGIAMIVNQPSIDTKLTYRDDGKDIFVVLEELQDPGNMGTIIRMADAFDFNGVIYTEGSVDPYNEKVLRASMGSIWHIPMIKVASAEDAIALMKQKDISCVATHLNGDLLGKNSLKLPAAFFIGNEGNGLKNATTEACDCKIKIPMPGKAESLNAASAASIIGFVLSTLR